MSTARCVGLIGLFSTACLGAAPQSQPVRHTDSLIRLARSADGLDFKDSGQVLIADADRPDIIRLVNGELLAVFEKPGESPDDIDIAVTCSKNDGKTWLRARQIQIVGLKDAQVSSPELVAMPNGLVRLYFVTQEPVGNLVKRPTLRPRIEVKRSVAGAVIRSAVTRDGVEYRIDPQVHIPLAGGDDARLSAFWTDKQLILLTATPANDKDAKPTIHQWTSNDARTFTPGERVRFDGDIGHVLRLDRHHWRMYAPMGGEVRSRMSNDGARWRDEAICMRAAAAHPSVAPLEDKSFLMLYSSPMTGQAATLPQLAVPSSINVGEPRKPAARTQSIGKALPPERSEASPGKQSGEQDEVWQPFSSQDLDSEIGEGAGVPTDNSQSSTEFFPPKPDLRNRYDYVDWYRQNALLTEDQNAFEKYDVFGRAMMQRTDEAANMFTGPNGVQRPAPWNPADHPDWDASYAASQTYIDLFRQAAGDPRSYTTPLLFSITDTGWSAELPEGRDHATMADCLLPCLGWSRDATQTMLSQAWRIGDTGAVSPDAMIDAWQKGLGAARHFGGSATAIEHLAGARISSIVDSNARWALHWNVFTTPDQLEQAYQTLRDKDAGSNDQSQWIRSEYAVSMDMIQNLFVPTQWWAEPQLNLDEAKRLFPEQYDDLAGASVEDGYAAIDAVDQCFRELESQLAAGYPAVRAADVQATIDQWVTPSKVARLVVPSYARMSQLLARTEASRRATQLSYAVELFRSREGRLPNSLDEVATDNPDIRVDPFTGSYFGYRVENGGARIYSMGENGIDDGGQHTPNWGSAQKFNLRPAGSETPDQPVGPDDYVFWPPQE